MRALTAFAQVSNAQPEQGSEAGAGSVVPRVRPERDCRLDGRRATAAERRCGWLRGKSSVGRKPMDGCGVKQSHEVLAGSNR